MKKAIYFTIDAVFATALIGLTIIIVSQYFVSQESQSVITYYSKDIINSLSNVQIRELNDSYLNGLILSGIIVDPNSSILEQIGEFYALNQTELATNLSIIVSDKLIPPRFGFEILVNNFSILFRDSQSSRKQDLVSMRRLISGIEQFRPVRGSTSRVYLEGIQKKQYSTYQYFGGFVGQGNISGFIDDIPDDVEIIDIYLELDAASDFKIDFNGNQCGSTFIPGTGTMSADAWDLSFCNSSYILGERNNYSISFLDTLGTAYIGGGMIRISYFTDELQPFKLSSALREKLPGIQGIVNLYSSFYVPGELYNITVYLHYYANVTNITENTFYFTIANTTIYTDSNLTGEKYVLIDSQNISDLIHFSSMNRNTIPIRLGFENVSYSLIVEGNGDVALITDVSGSMNWRMDNNNNGIAKTCSNPDFNSSNTSRISVAKCLDIEFASNILNIEGNRVGLISYDDQTHNYETVYPTSDLALISSTVGTAVPLTGYEASGATCICCGINSAKQILIENISRTILIPSGSNWIYNDFDLQNPVIQDFHGRFWFEENYLDESTWNTGDAILGATNGYIYTPTVVTEMASNLLGLTAYANLWEHDGDNFGPPNDFSSGILNTTGNTYGISGDDDGWDWDLRDGGGPFGYDDDIDYNHIVSGKLEFDNNFGGSGNVCINRDCSGAYGIMVNITPRMFEILGAQGSAILSFYYEWDDRPFNFFENDDQVWIKARWTSPYTGGHYLGEDLDSIYLESDPDPEIATQDNPDIDIYGRYSGDISSIIEGPGMYYLEIGGKILANSIDEWGYFRFDDIQIAISNVTDHYYFRKNFTVSDISQVKKGVLNILSDDFVNIYINGNLVYNTLIPEDAKYWNNRGINVPGNVFHQGNNLIAVELLNSKDAAKFDLELIVLNDSTELSMMVMTDGQANVGCVAQGVTGDMDGDGLSDTASDDAVKAACEAREEYGIRIFAVGYSEAADELTLEGIAKCGEGIFRKSDNASVLQEFYQDVASAIISSSKHSQVIEIEGSSNIEASILYDDSYIQIEYLPYTEPPTFGEISLIIEEKNFNNCNFTVYLANELRVTSAKLSSYSSEHWTDLLIINDFTVFNLSHFSDEYTILGDPFIINIPPNILHSANNTFFINTGDSPQNTTNCSTNNSVIFTAQLQSSVPYSNILEKAIGCTWFIEFDDGDNTTISVPENYLGPKQCNYSSESIFFDENDIYDYAVYELLDNLDFDDDGRIFVNIDKNNMIISGLGIHRIPYPWGPAVVEMRVWR